jgi:hypothetical protein
MKKTWIAVALLAPALLRGDAAQTSCPLRPFDVPFDLRSPRERQTQTAHSLSVVAEAVAATGRHRAVGKPGPDAFPSTINFVDADAFAKMKKDGVVPTVVAGDEEFLRRVTLDLTGQIPDAATVQSFLADATSNKRAKMIDTLLASDAFNDRWSMWLGDLVQNVQVSANIREFPQGRNAYYTYIHDSIKAAKPYDQMVRELISGKGDTFAAGQADYWVRQIQNNGPIQDTYDNLAAHAGEKFLGMPLLCLSCHSGLGHLELVNGTLKSKTRGDFWGMAAFFARTRAQRQIPDPTTPQIFKFDVTDQVSGGYNLNTTSGNKTARAPVNGLTQYPPAYMFTGETPRAGEAWRDALGRMLTADRQFARATANYLWKEMFSLAIVEPPNNIDPSKLDTQATNPALLEDLASELIADKYDLRAFLRTVANSSTYQLSTYYTRGTWNEQWTTYYIRHLPHRLIAEALLDAIAKSTSVPVSFTVNGLGTVNAAMKLPDTTESRRTQNGQFLDEFGRGNRDDESRSNDSSISQALSMMNNSQIVVTRIHRNTANSTVAKVLASTSDPQAITDQLYMATLSRHPSDAERLQAFAFLTAGNLNQRTEDLQWVLLNSLEFLFD